MYHLYFFIFFLVCFRRLFVVSLKFNSNCSTTRRRTVYFARVRIQIDCLLFIIYKGFVRLPSERCGNLEENLFYIFAVFGRCLNESHIVALSKRFAYVIRNFSLTAQVAFIAFYIFSFCFRN